MSYIFAVVLLGFIVLIHEAGHFAAAKLSGIGIKVFSVGFGPKLFGVRYKGTEYRLSLVPIGGYVLPEAEDEEEFFRIPVGRRAVMAAGGPLASLLLAFASISVVSCAVKGLSLNNLLIEPLKQLFYILPLMAAAFVKAFGGQGLSGVIGIVSEGGGFIRNGFLNTLEFSAMLNLNFFVLNLLPFPILDGGKLLLYALEKVNPRMKKLQYPLAIAGWVLMLGLMVYVTVLDIGKYIV